VHQTATTLVMTAIDEVGQLSENDRESHDTVSRTAA